jgi:Domain of unknown function (DUF4145)
MVYSPLEIIPSQHLWVTQTATMPGDIIRLVICQVNIDTYCLVFDGFGNGGSTVTISKDDINLGPTSRKWQSTREVDVIGWICGYCGDQVSSKEGWFIGGNIDGGGQPVSFIRICPSCNAPTFFARDGKRFPSNAPGRPVPNVPDELSKLYNEARASAGAGAYTASVLACRKILMHIAVEEGAKSGEAFIKYVEYLDGKNYLPPKGKVWVNYIRTRSNEANHEIMLMDEKDAIALVTFVEMLLRFIYEFPNMVPQPPASTLDTGNS